MKKPVTRRNFIATAGAAAMAATATSNLGAAGAGGKLRILGIACSARKGKTTSEAVQTALDAAKAVDSRLEVELIDLGGLNIAGWRGPDQPADDFNPLLAKLQDPAVAGLIFGSPCYFRSISSVAKCFIERLMPLRSPEMVLADKPLGVVAVGGGRNGGQELVITQIQSTMLSFGMIPVGGRAPAFLGGTLVNSNDSVAKDEIGLNTARMVGKRVGEVALRLAGTVG